jgi:hypothetical protein
MGVNIFTAAFCTGRPSSLVTVTLTKYSVASSSQEEKVTATSNKRNKRFMLVIQ